MSVAILADKFVSIDGIDRDDAIFDQVCRPTIPSTLSRGLCIFW
jgi:hypothetical protein